MTKLICLMPTYNKESTLSKAIESVIMQKTDFDYKLIILDDCSSDNSNKIAKEFQEKYPEKIEIVRNETNLKLLHSIIKGYSLLKGASYFCVLDADDWYTYDKKFADAVSFLDKHKNYSMYMTNVLVKKDSGETPFYTGELQELDFGFEDKRYGKALFIQTSGVVYRNLYFKNGRNNDFENILNYKYPQTFRADGFRFEWYLKGGKAHFVNHIESIYNYNDEGIWARQSEFSQGLLNTKLLYSCSEFFVDEKEYYLKEAKRLFNKTLQGISNISTEDFEKSKNDIAELSFLLALPVKTKSKKIIKLLINCIPFKKFRKRVRERILS